MEQKDERRLRGWEFTLPSYTPPHLRPNGPVTFNPDDGVGGASPRVFFFYYHLWKYEESRFRQCRDRRPPYNPNGYSNWHNGSIAGKKTIDNEFCLPFMFDNEYSYMNATPSDKDKRKEGAEKSPLV